MLRLGLVLAFVVTPLVELYVLIRVGQVIGGWQTLGLLLLVSLAGGVLLRREGARTWRAFRAALGSGRVPAREVADGAAVLLGGALLLTPGFVTDAVGLVLLLPVTRPLARRLLTGAVARRLVGPAGPAWSTGRGRRPPGRPGARRTVVDGTVVDGTVLDGTVVDGTVVDGTLGQDPPPDPGRRPGAG